MKHLILVLAIFMTAVQITTIKATAHTLKIDGSIGVTLHSDPNDDLRAGQTTNFVAEIQDKSGQFDPDEPGNCECIFTISKEGNEVVSIPIVVNGKYIPLNYIFKEGGVYDLTVSGKPKAGSTFQSFSISYSSYVRADGLGSGKADESNRLKEFMPFIFIAAGIVLVLLITDPISIRRKNFR